MESETQDLIKAEHRRQSNCRFLTETTQGGRIRPATFIHELQMPHEIFGEMKDLKLIDIDYLARRERDKNGRTHDPIAFFEFKPDMVVVSFHHIFNREDFRGMVDRYLIIKAYGYYPCKANWTSKLNFDRKIELVQLVKSKPKIQ